jgi:hypothetical protein
MYPEAINYLGNDIRLFNPVNPQIGQSGLGF